MFQNGCMNYDPGITEITTVNDMIFLESAKVDCQVSPMCLLFAKQCNFLYINCGIYNFKFVLVLD